MSRSTTAGAGSPPTDANLDRVVDPATARVLEIDALLDLLAGGAQTEMGAGRVGGLQPSTQIDEIEARLDAVEATRDWAAKNGYLSLSAASPLEPILRRLHTAGIVLHSEELLAVGRTAGVARELRRRLADAGASALGRLARATPDLSHLVGHIDGLFDPDGEVCDDASPALARARRRGGRLRSELRTRMDKLAHDDRLRDVLSESLVTERAGRYVLPVRSGRREAVEGIVHDSSSSGQTVFVEPLELVEPQNRLAEVVRDEAREVQRLLAEATAHVAAAAPGLEQAIECITELDGLQALARYSNRAEAVRPRLIVAATAASEARSDDQAVVVEVDGRVDADPDNDADSRVGLRLRGGRHPLMETADAADGLDVPSFVPLDLELSSHQRALVITGPNTGGKTVLLKSIGLLTFMAQCGVPVPAVEAWLPVVPRLYADIGDEQSISASLSTFSGHLERITSFLADCPAGSLVLLDELGTGTDPAEGAALAIAVAERFVELGALLMLSTHHDALKSFAHSHPSAVNAAMEFDAASLAPTYRVRVGRPGRSSALLVAAGLGLDAELVARARGLLSGDAVQLDRVIERLEEEAAEAEESRRRQEEDLDAQRVELESSLQRLRAADAEHKKRATELQAQLKNAIRDVAESLRERGEQKLAELGDVAPATGQRTPSVSKRTADNRRARWRSVVGTLEAEAHQSARERSGASSSSLAPGIHSELDEEEQADAVGPLARGQRVHVEPFGMRGRVLHEWTPRGRSAGETDVEIDVGGKRMLAPRQQVRPLGVATGTGAGDGGVQTRASKRRARAQRGASVARGGGTSFERRERFSVATELKLVGQTVDDALAMADKYLDDALLAELTAVRLIHGYGSFKLRDALHEWLRDRPGVSGFGSAGPRDGGAGVTIVNLGS